ncbi:hypothetical protein F0562_006310 [Nyssa sinensis]|uniref:Retrotransposon Copia-like N-terminal domain-containing protein n=1 Tax=Nyssa sinensis TaxID=561372 RepID=A0A5J5ARE7_9ASTE|nr:hypothetical protein F0562_006310 [Nyssa sinensis]
MALKATSNPSPAAGAAASTDAPTLSGGSVSSEAQLSATDAVNRQGSIPMPFEQIEVTVDDAAQRVANPRFTEWKRADRHLRSAINATIHPSLLPHVVNLKHAFEVWNVLEKRMNSASRSHIMQLRNDLQRVKKDSAKPMKNYLDEVKQITDKLAETSNTISDEEIVLVILKGLPREYMSFKTTIRAREASIIVEELSNLLLSEEINISMEELELSS